MDQTFQGVACCCFDNHDDDDNQSIETTFNQLLDLKLNSIIYHDIKCSELELSNKYYKTKIHLFDNKLLTNEDPSKKSDIYKKCQAIIFYGDGKKLTCDSLDAQVDLLKLIQGEPRILLYHGIDEECEPYKTLSDWCLKNNFDFIDTCDEEVKDLLINSLSAYKWEHRISSNNNSDQPTNSTATHSESSTTGSRSQDHHHQQPQQQRTAELNDETLKKLMDFDNLLGKLSAIKDRPELRGNPDDKNIVEIAEILSNLLGDDAEGFLDSEDDEPEPEPEDNNMQDSNGKSKDE